MEFDNTVIFIDMLLHKPQVYRHLLFNRLSKSEQSTPSSTIISAKHALNWDLIKLSILLILFEVYIKWLTLDGFSRSKVSAHFFFSSYTQILYACCLEFVTFHLLLVLASSWIVGFREAINRLLALFSGSIISSFGKLLHIVMIIWDYREIQFSYLIDFIVFTSNLEAISAVFSLSYPKSVVILILAYLGKAFLRSLWNVS